MDAGVVDDAVRELKLHQWGWAPAWWLGLSGERLWVSPAGLVFNERAAFSAIDDRENGKQGSD